MTRIFLSHASKDRDAFVNDFDEFLHRYYLDTWFSPRDIPAGSWHMAIRDGLALCDWFIVICTPNALESTGSVEGVTDWVRERYVDQANRRYKVAVDTTLFSLLQSLLYEYPDDWSEVVRRLSAGVTTTTG